MNPALAVQGVSKSFGSHAAVEDVTFDVSAGEAVVLVGPSGCGKTTLLRLIAGLEVPEGGEIRLEGLLVTAPRRTLVAPHRRRIGFVFQDLALWPHMTVQKNLTFVLESLRVPTAERATRLREALKLVRVDHLASRYPHQLSGGEQQRLALARALVGRPRLLLLDEPFSSLDPELRAALREELRRLQRSLEVTTIYVTHDRGDATALADRVLTMREGRLVAPGRSVSEENRA